MSDQKWYFTEEQLANSPSRKCGINAELELSYRQRAANLIQEMGQRLQVSQLCINTAIVYMHRFYAFHSFTMFHRNSIAAAAFFLAAKVEEQPRKLEHVIKILNICLEKTDITRDTYAEQAQELVFNENILLQTLGFDVAIDHPHTHVVKACQLFNIVTVSRELRQTCYFMASNSLHLTTMCLKYRPTVVAAFCIYIACKWSRWEIPDSSEGKAWYSYVDESVTLDTLKKLTDEYLQILERSPSKFKSKMKAITSNGQAGMNQSPSVGGTDGPSTSHHKTQHHHHHHHHHRNNSTSSATSSMVNSNGNGGRKPYDTNPASSAALKPQMHPMTNSSSSSYKQVPSQPSMNNPSIPPTHQSSASATHRSQRPQPSGVSGPQPPYPGSGSNSNSQIQKTAMIDERLHPSQRMMHQDGSSYYNSSSSSSSSSQRMSDHKHRMSSAPQISQQQHLQQQQQSYMKPANVSDQKQQQQQQHNLMKNSQQPPYPGMDLHQKNIKQQAAVDYRSNPQMNQQMSKKPPWQQPSSHQQQMQQNQEKLQYPHLQKNLQMPNAAGVLDQGASNVNNTKSNMSGYGDMSMKQMPLQQQQQHSSSITQNDFWLNDKINETTNKTVTPPRQSKSLFSPSPEQDSGEKMKYMMMTGSLKRGSENAVDSPKDDRKSSTPTPTKREKSMLANSSQNQKLSNPLSTQQISSEKKYSTKHDSLTQNIDSNAMDAQMMKKRPYSSIKEPVDSAHGRESKIRKTDQIKMESNVATPPPPQPPLPLTPQTSNASSRIPQQPPPPPTTPLFGTAENVVTKQPIETNPDIVKSLLKECFTSSSKFDAYDTDSPLDVINPEPPEELLAPTNVISQQASTQQQQIQTQSTSSQSVKRESNNSAGEDSSKSDKKDSSVERERRKDHKDHKKKSKKKKDKHKHKKKHKSSDREDNKSDSSLKIVLPKEKQDTKQDTKNSSPEYGSIKIKIPMKDVSRTDIPNLQTPAPIKLKISKEKFGSFTNLNSSTSATTATTTTSSSSSSSTHHKKKEKDREKSKKSSKHHTSDYKEISSYQ